MMKQLNRKSEIVNPNDRLGTESIPKLILQMGLPTLAAQLVNLLYSIVDRIYIGHIPEVGTDALAGIGVTSSIITLIGALAMFSAGGGSALAAIELGRGDHDRAERYLGNSYTLLLIFTAVSMIAGYATMKPLLLLIGASEKTLPYAVDYLSVYLTGTLFVMTAVGLNTFITAQGRSDLTLISVLLGAGLNIGLDPVFIFVFSMGVKGAAIATVISQMISSLFMLKFLVSPKASLRLKAGSMRLQPAIVKSILSLGVSPFVMASTESLIGFVLNGRLVRYGDIYVSALTILQSAMMILSIPCDGFARGVSPIISYNFGHRSMDRVRKAFKILLAILFTFNFTLAMLMIISPGWIVRIFTGDPRLIRTACDNLPVFMTGITIFGVQRACQNTFVALGQAKISLFIALLRKVFLLIPLAYILPVFLGYKGVFLAESVADATAAVICILIFRKKFPQILENAGEQNK